jgi:hypothetical protein
MRRIFVAVGVIFLAVLLIPSFSKADTFTFNWAEQNGLSEQPLPFTLDAGSLAFAVPAGQTIVDAFFSSTLGNTRVGSTAAMDVFVNSVLVGSCPSTLSTCWIGGPNPFTFSFSGAELSALATGSVDLSIVQTGCCRIRLGASTLTVDTRPTTETPEPATLALLGTGMFGLVVIRRRKRLA